MRLIDADALIKRWKYHFNHRNSLVNCIMTQPTAFDVDKVVEKLEEYKKQWMDPDYLDGIDEIIDIIRKGGVE